MKLNKLLRFLKKDTSLGKNSACIAKERLQIVISHQRNNRVDPKINNLEFIDKLKDDILLIIKRYIKIQNNDINIDMNSQDGKSILELNIKIPEKPC